MLNAGSAVDPSRLRVLSGVELNGQVNVAHEEIYENVRSSLRRQLPQIRPQPQQMDRVCLVGGGPSLQSPQVQTELRDLVYEGAVLVTVNGSYQWAIERNLRPQCQIVVDARPGNVRFLIPAVPRCRYILASQCHPTLFDAVSEREEVWIAHPIGSEDPVRPVLDEYYCDQWFSSGGGTTVTMIAIGILRMVGYLRFDLFGVDSCWMNGEHHAYVQPENDHERSRVVETTVGNRTFVVSPWHLKQLEDFLQLIRVNGDYFLINVHGDGLLAHALRTLAASEET